MSSVAATLELRKPEVEKRRVKGELHIREIVRMTMTKGKVDDVSMSIELDS